MEKTKIEIFEKYIIKSVNKISKSNKITDDEKEKLRKNLLLLCDQVYSDGFKSGFSKGMKYMTGNIRELDF